MQKLCKKNSYMKLGRKWRHFDELLSELFLDLSPDRNMISDFGFQEHIQLLKLDVLLGTDFCQTRTTLRHFVAKNNYGSSYYSCGLQYYWKSSRGQNLTHGQNLTQKLIIDN